VRLPASEVVLQQIRRRELQPAGVERLEQGVGVQLVIHRDQDEEQAPGDGLRKDLRDLLACVVRPHVQLVDLLREIPVALPQQCVGPRQAARVERPPELHQVVLVERIVDLVQAQPAALHERRRVLLADETVAKLGGALAVPFLVRALVRHAPQLADDGQGQQGNGRQPLLTVDDEELAVAVGLHDQRTHVVTPVGIAAQLDDVVPEVFPLLLRPGVVPLVRGHAIGLAVADQLQIAGRAGVEDVRPAHRSPPPPAAVTCRASRPDPARIARPELVGGGPRYTIPKQGEAEVPTGATRASSAPGRSHTMASGDTIREPDEYSRRGDTAA
jgi:hypothetical protein